MVIVGVGPRFLKFAWPWTELVLDFFDPRGPRLGQTEPIRSVLVRGSVRETLKSTKVKSSIDLDPVPNAKFVIFGL